MERLTPVEIRAPGEWQIATVTDVIAETPRVKSFRFSLPMWMAHLPAAGRLDLDSGQSFQ